MVGFRRVLVAAIVGIATLGTAGAVEVATAPAGGAAPPACTDSWQGPAMGTTDWNLSAANWSSGFPTSSSVVCIQEAGSYTVTLDASASIGALVVGGAASGAQTLELSGSATNVSLTLASASELESGGTLTLASGPYYSMLNGVGLTVDSGSSFTTTGSSGTAYLRTNLTNNGSANIGAASTTQDQTTTTTNDGSFTVASGGGLSVSGSGGFTNDGTLTVTGSLTESNGTFTESGGAESGNPVVLSGGALADTAGTGAFQIVGNLNLSGTIPANQTVTIAGSVTNITVGLATAVIDDGTLTIAPGPYYAILDNSALTVGSGGKFTTSGASGTAYLRVPLTIDSGGSANIGAASTTQDQTTTTTNDGSFTVASGGGLSVSGSGGFTNDGTLTVTGSLTESNGTFTESGGAESGNPVVLSGGALADTAGTGAFQIVGNLNLSGTIPANQTVTIAGSVTNITVGLATAVIDDGTLTIAPGPYYAILDNSALTVGSGGKFTTSGASGTAYLRVPLTIDSGGSANIGAASTTQDQTTTTTNDGSFTVASGGGLSVSGSGGFTNDGTLTVTGSLTESNGTFTESGGAESGNPVVLSGGALADTAGTGAFQIVGNLNLSGTIPANQTVTIAGSVTNITVGLATAVIDDGTLTIAPGPYYAILDNSALTVGSGGKFTTSGASGTAYLRVPLTIDSGGSANIGAASTTQDQTTTTTNSGTLQVLDGGHLSLSGGASLTNNPTGSLGVTVDQATGVSGISGSGVSLAGTLSVTTVGSPTLGTIYSAVSGPGVTGTFTTLSFGPHYYVVTYPTGTVQLQIEQGFTSAATTFAPLEGEPMSPQVASIGDANDEPGTYSATVNYGDGSGAQSGTVNLSGSTGSVFGPAHTYAKDGTYPVTVVISNTSGTTETVSENVTVTGPTITGLSKTSVLSGKKLSTVISGTGFDSTASFTTSDPSHVTVVSVKASKITKRHPNLSFKLKLAVTKGTPPESVSITLTQTGTDPGKTTAVNAITVT